MALRKILISALVLIGLTACGQKGPLYLPAEPEQPEETKDATETEEETQEKSEKSS